MNLSLPLLREELAPLVFESHNVDDPLCFSCTYGVAYASKEEFEQGPVYVARSDELPKMPVLSSSTSPHDASDTPEQPISLICVGKPPETFFSSHFSILYTDEDVSENVVCARIARVFNRYYQWECTMQQAIDKRMPLRAIGESALPFLNNPFFVQSASFRCEFIVRDFPELYDAGLYEKYCQIMPFEDETYFPLEIIRHFMSDPAYTKAVQAEGPTLYRDATFDEFSKTKDRNSSLFCNIGSGKRCVARLIVSDILHRFTSRDYAVASILCGYLEKAIRGRTASSYERPRYLDSVLEKLLGHHLVDERKIISTLFQYQWNVEDCYMCLVAKSKSADRTETELRTQAMQVVPLLPNDCSIVFEGHIVFVLNLTQTRLSRDSAISSMVPILRDNLLIAGMSDEFYDFKNLYYYHQQAIEAMECGLIRDPTFWCFRYEDYLLDDMITRCRGKQLADTLMPKGLLRLAQYDKLHSTDHVALLRTFLKNNMNVAETSRLMYLQRSTCLYRLKRIREITMMDLDDSDTRLELLLAFKLSDSQES